MVASEYTYDKRHVLIFRTQSGEMIVGTNNLTEVSDQDWFREFLAVGRALRRDTHETRYEERPQAPPVPRPVNQQSPVQEQPPMRPQTVSQQMGQFQAQRPPMPSSFLEITPQDMTMPVWESLNAQQQAQWMQRYNIQG